MTCHRVIQFIPLKPTDTAQMLLEVIPEGKEIREVDLKLYREIQEMKFRERVEK